MATDDDMDQRRGPEARSGAEPADGDAPEHSQGIPLDQAQPSAPRRPELESDEAKTDDADVNSSQSDV